MFSRDRFVGQSLSRAAVSIVGVATAIISTISIASAACVVGCAAGRTSAAGVAGAAGIAARPASVEGVARYVSAAVVTDVAGRLFRSCAGGGPALVFKLTSCSLIRTHFDTGSGPQFMRLAYGAGDSSIEEDALH